MIRANDTIRAIADLLRDDATIQAQCLAGTGSAPSGRVYAHFAPLPPSDSAWGRITVRELDTGGLPEHATSLVHLPVQILIEVKGIQDAPLLLAAMHERAETLLDDLKVETAFGDGYVALERRRRPSPPRYDEATGAFYSAALYSTILASS